MKPVVNLFAIVVMLVVVVGPHPPAIACSLMGAESIERVLADDDGRFGEVTGVYEQRQIARVPSLWFRSARSVSVVDRYWGDPPPNLGLVVHGQGGINLRSECGNAARPVSHTVVGLTREDTPATRDSRTAVVGGQSFLDTGEAVVETRFGPPVVLDVGLDDYVLAYTVLLWQPVALLAAFVGLAVLERRLRPDRDTYTPNPVTLGLVGVTTLFLWPDSNAYFWRGSAIAVGLAIGLAWISRFAVAIIGAGIASLALLGLFDTGSLDFPAGLISIILGIGALAWTGSHWTRWPASFAGVAGWWLITRNGPGTILAAITVAILTWANHRLTHRNDPAAKPERATAP